jgi:hypothetical protein
MMGKRLGTMSVKGRERERERQTRILEKAI